MLLGIETMILRSQRCIHGIIPQQATTEVPRKGLPGEAARSEGGNSDLQIWMEEISAGFSHGFSNTKPVVNKYRQDFWMRRGPNKKQQKHKLFVV